MSDAMELRYVISEQPYEPWERDMQVAAAKLERDDPASSAIGLMVHSQALRWDATLRQLEQCLVAVTAERDATLRALEAELVTVRNEKHTALRERDHWITRLHIEQEKHTDTDAARTRWLFKAAELERERDAYKAFVDAWLCDRDPAVAAQVYMEWRAVNGPGGNERWVAAVEALREIADLEDKPQPSGNSGGFAAAAGILADTWDGEPSEVTIRRLRDGTPAEEELP